MNRPHVSIVGLPGTGKSTIAPILASRLDLVEIDLDEFIETSASMGVSEIFAAEGEDGFRDREERALAQLVDADEPARLVSCGGGVVLRAANRRRLSERTRCVWLDASDETLAERLWSARSTRPLLGDAETPSELRSRVATLRAARAPYYEEVAFSRVVVDDLDVASVSEAAAVAVA